MQLRITELKPNPKELMRHLAVNNARSSLVFGFIHGSMVSSPDGALNHAYKEVRIHDPFSENIVSINFEIKAQPPDIDIVVVVKDRAKFKSYLSSINKNMDLSQNLNYFLTLNVMTLDTLLNELRDVRPRALRRILLYRPTWNFGDKTTYEEVSVVAKNHESINDAQFQREFEDRKSLLRERVLSGAGDFFLTPKYYRERFPMFFDHLSSDAGGFPEDRDKYVLPHSMDLKAKRYLGKQSEEQLR